MQLKRRDILTGIGGLAAASALSPVQANLKSTSSTMLKTALSENAFPRKNDFAIPEGLTYINGAYTHPMPIAAAEAVQKEATSRSRPGRIDDPGHDALGNEVKSQFAGLINAKLSEISFVSNTSTGENLVFNTLGIPGSGGNVVTDGLHFDGMLLHLQALQRDQGLDLRIAMVYNKAVERGLGTWVEFGGSRHVTL